MTFYEKAPQLRKFNIRHERGESNCPKITPPPPYRLLLTTVRWTSAPYQKMGRYGDALFFSLKHSESSVKTKTLQMKTKQGGNVFPFHFTVGENDIFRPGNNILI